MIYSNQDGNSKRYKAKIYYLPKGIIGNCNMMNRKSFYDQPFDSDIKRYGETNILTTGQGEDYTTVRLLHYSYIRNH